VAAVGLQGLAQSVSQKSTSKQLKPQSRLAELEQVVERGQRAFVETGKALRTIRDDRLYDETYGTFEAYCKARFGMSRSQAYRLIDASACVELLSPIGDITESVVRPLTKLEPDGQRKVWAAVADRWQRPTAANVATVINDMFPRPAGGIDKRHLAYVNFNRSAIKRRVEEEVQQRMHLLTREKLREQLPEEVEALREAKDRAHAKFMKYAAMSKGIAAQMTEEDYRFLLNVLHPDRAPEDRREKFARAFDIVRKLDGYIKACKA